MTQESMPIALFNGTIATTNGLFRISDISIDKAKKLIEEKGYISAVGHAATANVLSEILEKDVPMARIQFHQKVGQLAIAFKLNIRPPEGMILNRDEMLDIGFSLKLLERLE